MQWKLQCLQLALVMRKGLISSMTMLHHTLHNQQFKSWTNWATKLCLVHHIHLTSCQLTTTSSSVAMTFCRENTSITSRRHVKFRSLDIYATGINKLILIDNNVLIVMVPILINKDVLEPSYNLKFTSKSSITFYQHNAVVLASFIEIYWHLTCKFKVCLWWFDTCIYCEMITTVGPANIFIPSYNYLFWLKMQKLFNNLSIYFPTSVSTFSASQWVQL